MKFELKEKCRDFFSFCRQNKKITLSVLILVILVTALQTVSVLNRSKSYITDQEGRVTAIARGDRDKASTIPLKVKVVKARVKAEQNLVITLQGKGKPGKEKKKAASSEEELLSQVANAVREVEQSEDEKITLPVRMEDGTRIIWYRDGGGPSPVPWILFPLVMVMLYRDSLQKKRNLERKKLEDIRRSLPSFNNQLLLLLGSGLIFHDAFTRIADGYERRPKRGNNFSDMISEIMKKAELAGNSLVTTLEEYAKRLSVKEFSRITNIIADNQYKGVNLMDKLEAESDILWTQRKKIAEEKGRIAETKLTFPLALLLLVLIIVTAAPAIMEM